MGKNGCTTVLSIIIFAYLLNNSYLVIDIYQSLLYKDYLLHL